MSEPFQLRVLTTSNPERGIWDVAPSEAAFSCVAIRTPGARSGDELEDPQPLKVELRSGSSPGLRNWSKASSQCKNIHWEGHARIETTGRAALMDEFAVDPRIQVDSVTVVENDVDRLLRYIREEGRLLLFLRDDRPGVQIIRMSGSMSPPSRNGYRRRLCPSKTVGRRDPSWSFRPATKVRSSAAAPPRRKRDWSSRWRPRPSNGSVSMVRGTARDSLASAESWTRRRTASKGRW